MRQAESCTRRGSVSCYEVEVLVEVLVECGGGGVGALLKTFKKYGVSRV